MAEAKPFDAYGVGEGVLTKMAEKNDSPAWTHEYGFEEGSFTLGQSGRLYVYDAVNGRVLSFQPDPA